MTYPPKMEGRRVQIMLIPSMRLREGNRDQLKPISVGTLYSGRGLMEGGLSIPADVAQPPHDVRGGAYPLPHTPRPEG